MGFEFGLTSIWFLVFFAGMLLVYWVCPRKWRWISLLVGSVIFFIMLSWKSIFFLIFATITTYLAARYIGSQDEKQKSYLQANPDLAKEERKAYRTGTKKNKKRMLIFGIIAILAVLIVMKYLSFLIDTLNQGLVLVRSEFTIPEIRWFLPLGISFYTFQAIGYLVDCYWGKIQPEKNFAKFSLFMVYFPKIMQGPIARYEEMQTELFGEHSFDYNRFVDGLTRMAWGYFKKMVIADCFVVFIQFAFGNVASISGLEAALTIVFYFIYDYCDFSGYMDITIGLSNCFCISMPENFNNPYFARSIDEYWRRWHITLGRWFKDYVFYPLSISRFSLWLGKKSKHVSKGFGSRVPAIYGLLVVWFLTGLWHGASWNYVLWGLYYGLIIILEVIFQPLFLAFYKKTGVKENVWWMQIISRVFTLLLLAFGKVLFMSDGPKETLQFFAKAFTLFQSRTLNGIRASVGLPSIVIASLAVAPVFARDLIQEIRPSTTFEQKLRAIPTALRWAVVIGIVVAVVWFGYYGKGMAVVEFGYVQF